MQRLSLMLGPTWLENAGVASIRPLSPRVDTLLAAAQRLARRSKAPVPQRLALMLTTGLLGG
jgi:hypothetical protein